MAGFYHSFTQKAQQALQLAEQSAIQLGHHYIGSEHLLLGLMKTKDCLAAKLIEQTGVTAAQVEDCISRLIGSAAPDGGAPEGLTPRTKRILELSAAEASRLGHSYIGTEHILLGILREGESVALQILSELGVDLQKLFSQLAGAIQQGASGGATGSSPSQNTATPTLEEFGRDLTAMAKEGKFDPVIGRDKEIERVIQILSRRTKNNPCLIGEPGVGKTAIAEGLAQKIAQGNVPELLRDKRVVTLDLSSMVAGAKYRGEFEERLKKAIDEIIAAKNVIIFIDEMHTIIGAGAAEGAIDASNILKPALARGEMQVVGATTLNEYKKYIEKDAALERRFQPVTIGEPTVEETVQILKGLRDKYEAHHGVAITDEALQAAAELSHRYIADRFLPDKAIDLIDEAASRMRLQTLTAPPALKELEDRLEMLDKEKAEAVNHQDFEKAAKYRDQETSLKAELEEKKTAWEKTSAANHKQIGKEEIAAILSDWTGIPVKSLQEEESQKLLHMEELLHKRVIGQDEAVTAIAKAIRRGRVGLADPKRPTGSFLFLGPTGVGKTELSKALAEALFGDEDAMIRVDMSEYMEKHSVSRMVGSPPGYVGYDEGGQLTDKVRRKPYSVILFDEIEKAHPDVFNILLQIMEDGMLTDSQGRRVNFKNTIIIMTSNIGARQITDQKKALGFSSDTNQKEADYQAIRGNVMGELKKAFRPEFLNRIDDIIVFQPLSHEAIEQIARNMLEQLSSRLAQRNITAQYSDAAVSHLADVGFDPVYGARPLRRAITSNIEDLIAEQMLEQKIKDGDHITVDYKDNAFCIQ
ncbi:MAG: ATP-dependent Clp protease ATP-binding subunit [Clostridia bacterium]|nr:ATP-dependent Clp protease ATP-binding subunit [Clostridia bacterium]